MLIFVVVMTFIYFLCERLLVVLDIGHSIKTNVQISAVAVKISHKQNVGNNL
jgi:hypothetical protein